MAAFDVKRVALIIVLIGLSMLSCVAQTEATIACNSDDTGIACRYDCPAKLIQKHCITEKVVLDVVEGKCCPGYFKTENNKCQVCPDGRFMPDVNNCSECLLCTDCDTSNVANNTLEFRCNLTTNAGCKLTDDPTPCAHPDCPWIKSSSAAPTTSTQVPTTQVPTSEAVSVNTPRDPQESKSEQPYKAGFYAFMALFFLSLVVILLLCIYICKKAPPAAPPGAPPDDQLAAPPAALPAAPPGDPPGAPPDDPPGAPPDDQLAAPPAAPPGNQLPASPGDPPGGGGQVTGQAGVQDREDANHNNNGHAREPEELNPLLRGVVPPRVELQTTNV